MNQGLHQCLVSRVEESWNLISLVRYCFPQKYFLRERSFLLLIFYILSAYFQKEVDQQFTRSFDYESIESFLHSWQFYRFLKSRWSFTRKSMEGDRYTICPSVFSIFVINFFKSFWLCFSLSPILELNETRCQSQVSEDYLLLDLPIIWLILENTSYYVTHRILFIEIILVYYSL